ncbi:hypothetical protein ACQB60_35250 [Actinomycetota bacterium Odt1-20B]
MHLTPVTRSVANSKKLNEWDKTFDGRRLCAAIADRITFPAT